jgi:dihydrofolate synthase/folylpolyglutamate synthase
MFSKLPMYQRVGKAAYKPGLESMLHLDAYLGKPHQLFKSIHVGGTNGKGSTSHLIASVLQSSGYKVGLYTSPHLLDFRERIKINGIQIEKEEVIRFIDHHKAYFEAHQTSFFEMTVGLAFTYFNTNKVDYAVVEVGLGGRLDATNVITPVLSVITNIGLDHMDFLGTTRPEIAAEKAGIIKASVPVVIGEKEDETQRVFEQIAKRNTAPLLFAKPLDMKFETDLKGGYQEYNIRTALNALKGRWQRISEKPEIVLDVGHNKEGLSLIMEQLNDLRYEELHIVLGFVKGKNVNELISLFPKEATFYLSSPNIERAYPLEILKEDLMKSQLKLNYFESVEDSFEYAKSKAALNDLVLVCGSTFVVAEVLSYLNYEKS